VPLLFFENDIEMKVEQIHTSCLSEMTYYISDGGEAVVIDPLRNPAPYLKMAKDEGSTIKYIFLTHFHADFVSGHVDLAKATGAPIVYGPGAEAKFEFYCASDNEEFSIGNLRLKLLHTPGHTLESSSYLLFDEHDKEHCVFTGDCLFIGDVGRPDLAVKPGNISREYLAGLLYDSLHKKLLTLPDHVIVYPNHGEGSACGKQMSAKTHDTIGNQKLSNYALDKALSKAEFIETVLEGLTPPPLYFPFNAQLNKTITNSIEDVLDRGTHPIDPENFKRLAEDDSYLVVDTRSKENFIREGSVPGSIYIGIDGNFAYWVGCLIEDLNQKIIFIADDDERAYEIVNRFARVGYDNVRGFLFGGISNWLNHDFEVEKVNWVSAPKFISQLKEKKQIKVLDVRKRSEFDLFHVDFSETYPLEYFHRFKSELDKNADYYLYCNSGYRSLMATSMFNKMGFNKVTNVYAQLDDIVDISMMIPEKGWL
jgi:hydroxyacylglutathione hydrolase